MGPWGEIVGLLGGSKKGFRPLSNFKTQRRRTNERALCGSHTYHIRGLFFSGVIFKLLSKSTYNSESIANLRGHGVFIPCARGSGWFRGTFGMRCKIATLGPPTTQSDHYPTTAVLYRNKSSHTILHPSALCVCLQWVTLIWDHSKRL